MGGEHTHRRADAEPIGHLMRRLDDGERNGARKRVVLPDTSTHGYIWPVIDLDAEGLVPDEFSTPVARRRNRA